MYLFIIKCTTIGIPLFITLFIYFSLYSPIYCPILLQMYLLLRLSDDPLETRKAQSHSMSPLAVEVRI